MNKNKIAIALSLIFTLPVYAELKIKGDNVPEPSGVVYSTAININSQNKADLNSNSNDVVYLEKTPVPLFNKPSTHKAMITHIGIPENNLPAIKGFANNLPLIEVLKQITPTGWHAKKEKDSALDLNQLVSWRADKNKNWVDVLTKIANEYGFSAMIDWTNQELKLSGGVSQKASEGVVSSANTKVENKTEDKIIEDLKIKQLEEKAKQEQEKIESEQKLKEEQAKQEKLSQEMAKDLNKIQKADEVSAKKLLQANVQSSIEKSSVVNKQTNKEWTLKAGKTLKENILDWAKEASWEVAWDDSAVDYKIEFDVVLDGTFDDEENGPIAQVAVAYKQSHQPLVFSFKAGNKVLVVKNYVFEQKLYRESWQKYNKEN